MIQLPMVALPSSTSQALDALQTHINAVTPYSERVYRARERFSAENREDNETFGVIRRTLDAMCMGARRCMYCEDSAACEVEHFRPNVFYPEFVFVWMNYLYSCVNCNRIKRGNFRVRCGVSEYLDLVRRRNDAVVEPTSGPNVLIDPRTEDPLQYVSLDLSDTFFFVPRSDKGTEAHARAQYTIDCLKLNDRDYLTQARREAYGAYRARLYEYVEARGTERAHLLARAISRCGHRAVWTEMKAQSVRIAELAYLFQNAPEAHKW